MKDYVPAVRGMSRAAIENDSVRFLHRYYPQLLEEPGHFPVLDVFDYILRDDYGLDPCVGVLSDGTEGIAYPDGRIILSEETYRGAHNGNGRARFTVTHEIYHGIRHRSQIQRALVHASLGKQVLYRRSAMKPYENPEWQADTFASATLMPEPMVRKLAAGVADWELIPEMVERFGVSRTAAQVRIQKLRL